MSDIAISAEGLSKHYRIGGKQERYKTLRSSLTGAATAPFRRLRPIFRRASKGAPENSRNSFWALKDISFEIKRGEVVGIIGSNGAGKSTLLKILSRITEPTLGYADIHGRVGSLLEVGTGFHPELTGRENTYLNGAILGMRRTEIERKFDEIVAFAEVERFIDTPLKHYSSGMYLRLAFAVAAHLEPEILLIDEVLAVGDVSFQKKCLGKMGEVAKQGRTVLFVSHNMGAIRSLCMKGILLKAGRIAYSGDVGKSIESYFDMFNVVPQADEGTASDELRHRFGMMSLNGERTSTVLQSQEIDVSIPFHIHQKASGFSLYCILEDMHGANLFHLRAESTELCPEGLPVGENVISVKLPPLWLNPGLYSIYFKAFFWGDYATSARCVSDKFPLDIVGTSSTVDCLLHPQANWSLKRSD